MQWLVFFITFIFGSGHVTCKYKLRVKKIFWYDKYDRILHSLHAICGISLWLFCIFTWCFVYYIKRLCICVSLSKHRSVKNQPIARFFTFGGSSSELVSRIQYPETCWRLYKAHPWIVGNFTSNRGGRSTEDTRQRNIGVTKFAYRKWIRDKRQSVLVRVWQRFEYSKKGLGNISTS